MTTVDTSPKAEPLVKTVTVLLSAREFAALRGRVNRDGVSTSGWGRKLIVAKLKELGDLT